MPIYRFVCTKCSHEEEQLVKMGTQTSTCSKCGAEAVKTLSYKFASIGLPNGHFTMRSK